MKISPKVLAPFLVGLLGFAITWITTGNFDGPTLYVLGSTFVYSLLGLAAPPTRTGGVDVTQADLEAHAATLRRRRGR